MSRLSGVNEVELIALQSKNLDTICYRGSAPLAYLALVSQADVFDQVLNPEGLQRDLSPKHAADAYEYVHQPVDKSHPRAYPEVVLNVRDKKIIQIEPITSGSTDADFQLVRIKFALDKIRSDPKKVWVSRVDGNHRLFHAQGDDRREPLLAPTPFQLHVGLTREQERSLFVDINSNQKGLNTSHLSVMQGKLTPEEIEIRDHLDRWIANQLTNDPESPWHGLIHLGGSKQGARLQGLTRPVTLVSLQTGVAKTLTKSQYIHDLTDPHAQYVLVRNFWHAVKKVFAEEWARPKDYLLLKNIGVVSMSILGGTVLDRCLSKGKIEIDDMAYYLTQCRHRFDWNKNAIGEGTISGMSGNKAAMIVAAELASELSDNAGGRAMRALQERLLAQAKAR